MPEHWTSELSPPLALRRVGVSILPTTNLLLFQLTGLRYTSCVVQQGFFRPPGSGPVLLAVHHPG